MIILDLLKQSPTAFFAILNVFAFILALYFAIVIHEISHGYVALWNGDPTARMYGRLSLNPTKHFNLVGFLMLFLIGFGFAKPVPIDERNFKNLKKGKITVAISGIVANLLTAFVFVLIYLLMYRVVAPTAIGDAYWYDWSVWNYVAYFVYYASYWLVLISLNLALFNVLILYPLDGYRLLECFVPSDNGFMIFLRRYSMPILFGLLILGSVVPNYSPLNLYIYYCRQGLLNLFTAFWRLFGV